MSVCRRVNSTVVDPENNETFPGLNDAPVRVTSAERKLTVEGGVSVMARTTDEFPLFWVCEPNCALLRQPASAAEKISTEIGKIDRTRNMLPR